MRWETLDGRAPRAEGPVTAYDRCVSLVPARSEQGGNAPDEFAALLERDIVGGAAGGAERLVVTRHLGHGVDERPRSEAELTQRGHGHSVATQLQFLGHVVGAAGPRRLVVVPEELVSHLVGRESLQFVRVQDRKGVARDEQYGAGVQPDEGMPNVDHLDHELSLALVVVEDDVQRRDLVPLGRRGLQLALGRKASDHGCPQRRRERSRPKLADEPLAPIRLAPLEERQGSDCRRLAPTGLGARHRRQRSVLKDDRNHQPWDTIPHDHSSLAGKCLRSEELA